MTLFDVCQDSRGNTLSVEVNEVGGRRYWSDEIGGGVVVWDTSLASEEMVRLALDHEVRAAETEKFERAGCIMSMAAQVDADLVQAQVDRAELINDAELDGMITASAAAVALLDAGDTSRDVTGPCPCFPLFGLPGDNDDHVVDPPCQCFPK